MFEKPKRSGIPTAFDLTNLALRGLGKGLGAIAKAGGNVLKNANDEQHRKLAIADIHSIMFPGAVLMRGGAFPPVRDLRTHPLDNDELKRFDTALKTLRNLNAVPGYIKAFDARIVRIP